MAWSDAARRASALARRRMLMGSGPHLSGEMKISRSEMAKKLRQGRAAVRRGGDSPLGKRIREVDPRRWVRNRNAGAIRYATGLGSGRSTYATYPKGKR